jgi:glycosyltransferase involved in cell wall biosynthesis
MSVMNGHRTHVAVLGIKTLPAYAGADRVVEHILDHASPTNAYTVYLIRDGGPPLSCTPTRRYVYLPAMKGKYVRAPSYFLLCCLHFLAKGRYDVAHVHNSDFGIFCPLLKLSRRVRIVGTFHGDPATRDKWNWLAKTFLRASEWVFVRVCDMLTSVSAEKVVAGRAVHHIPNGADVSASGRRHEAEQQRPDLAVRNGEYVMFACGRLDRTKGLHHPLDAYRDVPTDKRLLVVGDFRHDVKYSAAVEEAGLADPRVVFHKRLLEQSGLREVLRGCSVFVFPSEVEGMSMMLLEGVAHAKVVVCSDIPANVAIVGCDYPFLFASQDRTALRDVLQRALNASGEDWDPGRLRDRITSTFSWDRIVLSYERLYEAGCAPR